MRNFVAIGAIAVMAVISASTASALDVDFNIATIETALPPGGGDQLADLVIDVDGNATTNMLAAGNLVAMQVVISNPTNESLTGIFTSVVYDGTQLDFLGSQGVPSEILVGGTTFSSTSLTKVANPDVKINSPTPDDGTGVVWVQATAFGSGAGTDGAGPDSYNIFFSVRPGVASNATILLSHEFTAGDATDAPTLNLESAAINIPEPGTALLMGLGLVGLGAAGRRRS
jgi:hypothetical protein